MNNKHYIFMFLILISSTIFLVGCNKENGLNDSIDGALQMDRIDENGLIETVQNATLEFEQQVWGRGLTIGEAFSDFFSTTEWKCIEFTQGERPGDAKGIVEFTGDMVSPSTGEVTNVVMNFKVYEGNEYATIATLTYNDGPVDHGTEKNLVSRIYDQVYYPEAVEQAINDNDDFIIEDEDIYDYYEPFFENNTILEEQLQNGLDPNSVNDHGYSLLVDSTYNNNLEAVKLLLEYGADPNYEYEGFTPLIVAADEGYNEILITLIEAGADVNQTGWSTPLIRAIVSGHTDIVEELIKHGADVNLMPTDGYSPLNEAEYYGNTEIINLLIQAGAKDFEL